MAKDYKETLRGWLEELACWGKNKWLWQEEGEGDSINGAQERIGVHLYTDGHSYSILATADYLGCTASTRKPRPGEQWTRGNHLADGKFSKVTWDRIIRDIVGYELKTISDYILNPPTEMYEGEETDEVRATG